MLTIWFIASTPSKAERPSSGAPAAWAEIPLNLNFPDLLELDVLELAELTSSGCQWRTTSTSLNKPALTM